LLLAPKEVIFRLSARKRSRVVVIFMFIYVGMTKLRNCLN
jgi:hypothetical protein